MIRRALGARMRGVRTATLLIALGLAAAVVFLHGRTRALEERLADVEARSTPAPRAAPEAGEEPRGQREPEPRLEGLPSTQVELERISRTVAELSERVGRAGDAAAGATGTPPTDRQVEEAVERLLEDDGFRKRLVEAARGKKLPKKPHIDLLTKALELDDGQARRFREELQAAQGELLALLSEKRADGLVPLEDVMKAEALPEGDPERERLWLKLLKLQIPGSEQTYVERAVEIAGAFRTQAATYLRADQQERFLHLGVDLFEVRIE
jgi:hypothetical protein